MHFEQQVRNQDQKKNKRNTVGEHRCTRAKSSRCMGVGET